MTLLKEERTERPLDSANVLRLNAVAVVESGALICVLQLFQDLHIDPRRVTAQRVHLRGTGREVVHIEIEVATTDLTMDVLRLIAAKIAQLPITLSTVFEPAPSTMRFRVLADADPSALICILQHLRRCNAAPTSVSALRRNCGYVEIKIEVDCLSDEGLQRLVAEINEMSMVVAPVTFEIDWHQFVGT